MPELEFSVYCNKCGNGLCGETTVDRNKVRVNPCQLCLDDALWQKEGV